MECPFCGESFDDADDLGIHMLVCPEAGEYDEATVREYLDDFTDYVRRQSCTS